MINNHSSAAERTERTARDRGHPLTLFVSYSHEDRVWMQRLKPILVGIQYDDRTHSILGIDEVSIWHDYELNPGDRWDDEIMSALDAMDIFIPLISAKFFASWYIMSVELPKAQERYERGEVFVVPILLEEIALYNWCTFLQQFEPLPAWGDSWSKHHPRSDAHRRIHDGLWRVIEKALARYSAQLPTTQ